MLRQDMIQALTANHDLEGKPISEQTRERAMRMFLNQYPEEAIKRAFWGPGEESATSGFRTVYDQLRDPEKPPEMKAELFKAMETKIEASSQEYSMEQAQQREIEEMEREEATREPLTMAEYHRTRDELPDQIYGESTPETGNGNWDDSEDHLSEYGKELKHSEVEFLDKAYPSMKDV